MKERRISSSGREKLRIREWGDPEAPMVVLVHGYPDNSDTWTGMAERLKSRFHVVAYDVRGAGESEAGWMFGGYGLERLVGDLRAVIETTAPRGAKVHLVGHDWGAIQGWEAVLDARLTQRLASFTSIGGPCLDHAAHWLRSRLGPDPRKLFQAADQLVRSSWYMTPMHLPGLVPAVWRYGLARAWPRVLRALEGAEEAPGWSASRQVEDGAHGVWLYRANLMQKLLKPGEGRTDLPVQLIVGSRDAFVNPRLYEETAARVPNLWRRDVKAGHWLQLTHPDLLARWITEFADFVDSGVESPDLQQARVHDTTTPRPPARRHHTTSHRLRVAAVEPLTADSVAITFDVPAELRETYRFVQGQHVAIRTDLGGEDVRRNYSICAPVSSGTLRIGVKRIPGGAFSSYAMEQLEPGDELEVMTPTGRFFTELDPAQARHYAAIAAGSGITPILSILATTLEVEPHSRFTLLYCNRTAESTMFRAELEELAKRHPDCLRIWHFLSREPQDDPLFAGRLDRARLAKVLKTRLSGADVAEWFLCGPFEMVEEARQTLVDHGVDAEHVHLELFHVEAEADHPAATGEPSTVTATIEGEETSFDWSPESGQTILDAVLDLGKDAPYACRQGMCGTCRAKLVEGTAEMDHNFALEEHEVREGYVLTCQAHPTSPEVVIDYDDA